MAKAQGGSGFVGGFVGGTVLSVVAFGASAIVIPPPMVEEAATTQEVLLPPRLPTLEDQTTTGPIAEMPEATRPQTSEPRAPASAPAVDPAVAPATASLAPAPSVDVGLESGAPVARSAPAPSTPVRPSAGGLSAPTAETPTLSAGATAPARPQAGTAAPGGALEPATTPTVAPAGAGLTNMNADGSLARPRVSGIQPEVGSTGQDAAPEADTASAPPPPSIPQVEPISEPVAPELAPRRVHAAAFSADADQALISVVLIDRGADTFPIETLAALSLPMTIAIPADAPDAPERAQAFRSAGFEVLALVPADVAASMSGLDDQGVIEVVAGVLEAVPQAVGLIDAENGAISRDNRIARAAVDYLTLTGHALVTNATQGLNRSDQVASSAGVPSMGVERKLNSEFGAAAISTGLQRVALDARSSGGVILLGDSDQVTINSVLTWALSSGVRDVSLAPITPLLERSLDN